LDPLRISVPVPACVRARVPVEPSWRAPENVVVLFRLPVVRVTLVVAPFWRMPAPLRDPMVRLFPDRTTFAPAAMLRAVLLPKAKDEDEPSWTVPAFTVVAPV
jgi:hypothetical protein